MSVILRTSALVTGTGLPGGGLTQLYWTPGTVGGSTADATDCLARFRTVWETFKARIHTSISINYDPLVLALEATTGVLTGTFNATDPATTIGTDTGDPLPYQTQGLLKWTTASVINGRRVRGRLFIPGPTEGSNTSAGVPMTTYTNDVVSGGGTLFNPGATTSFAVVWHRPSGAGAGAAPAITAATASPTWSVLRSRRS